MKCHTLDNVCDLFTSNTQMYVYVAHLVLLDLEAQSGSVHVRFLQAGRPKNSFFFWSTFVTRLLTPGSRKSGYGLFLGCRSGWDFGPFEKTFFWQSSNPKTGKIFTLCFGPKSQSIGRGRISREGALDHRESRERRDKIFAAQTVKRQNFNFQKKNWIRKTIFSGEFSFFWPREN